MVKRVISRECGNSWTGLTLYLFLPFLLVFPLFLSCFYRLWGSVRWWRPAVKNGLILTPSTLLFVQPPTPVYATHRHAEIKSLFFAKNSLLGEPGVCEFWGSLTFQLQSKLWVWFWAPSCSNLLAGWIAGLRAARNTCWRTLITHEIQCRRDRWDVMGQDGSCRNMWKSQNRLFCDARSLFFYTKSKWRNIAWSYRNIGLISRWNSRFRSHTHPHTHAHTERFKWLLRVCLHSCDLFDYS